MGQQFNFDYYGRENGLVSNEIDCIYQGSEGYMMFGTPSGLSIFDGATFLNYDVGKGYHHYNISDIEQMQNSELFLFTNSNQYYHIINRHLQADSFPVDDGIKKMYQTREGRWLACGYNGLYEWKDSRLLKLPVNAGKKYPHINCVLQWRDSLLIVGRSYESLDIYNIHTWQKLASSKEKLFIRNLFLDREGKVWISTIGNGILSLASFSSNDSSLQFEQLPKLFNVFASMEFRATVQDKKGNLWIAGINTGLIRYNKNTGDFMHITMDQGLSSNTIYSLCCDREDNIWIGNNRGVQKLVHKDVYSYSSREGLPADLVLDVLPLNENTALTCGYSGLGLINNYHDKAIAWKPPLADEYIFRFLDNRGKIYGLSLRALLELEVREKNIRVKKLFPLPEHVLCLVPFEKDKLILGGDSSLFLFKEEKLEMLTKTGVHHISAMTFDSNGLLWTASLDNLISCYQLQKRNTGISIELLHQFPVSTSGPQDYVHCMVPGKRKSIIYGTSRNGIFLLEQAGEAGLTKKTINASDGLSNNNVNFLSWFNDTTLLVGTGDGLDKIIFPQDKDTTFLVSNISRYYNIFNTVYNAAINKKGSVFLATDAGFFDIPSIEIEKEISKQLPILVSSVHLLNNPDSFINLEEPVRLHHNNNSISISWSSPSFTNEKSIRYTYVLVGKNDSTWSRPTISTTVTYSNLPAGHYRFFVKPVNINGETGNAVSAISIESIPPFWQTWWFFMLLGIGIASMIYLLIRRRIRTIQNESAFRSRIAETEMMALRAQMNPHFIFNCMNIIDGYITGNRNVEAQDFLQKFSRLIRAVLENSQYQLVPLEQDLVALRLYTELESIRFNHQFTYTFDIDEELEDENYKMPPLILQPFVENAIIHGLRNRDLGGVLKISIKKDGDGILAMVEDNGIGRKQSALLNARNSKPHQQLGMGVTSKRIELLKQLNAGKLEMEITDADELGGTGTRVRIWLPQDIKFE